MWRSSRHPAQSAHPLTHSPHSNTAVACRKRRNREVIKLQFLSDLGDAQWSARAAAELTRYGARAAPALYEQLGSGPQAIRRELERVLETIGEHPIPPDELRRLRAIRTLEQIGSPAAEQVLRTLAGGASHADSTGDARS